MTGVSVSRVSVPEIDEASAEGRRWHADERSVIFVVNEDRAFLTHRASWATALIAAGADVRVCCHDTGYSSQLRGLGIQIDNVELGRENTSAFRSVQAAYAVFKAVRRCEATDVVLLGTAGLICGLPAVVLRPRTNGYVLTTGLGRANTEQTERRAARFVSKIAVAAARLRGCRFAHQLPYGNRGARDLIIPGTGISTAQWRVSDRVFDRPVLRVAFASRLFREKGVYEFIDIAREVTACETDVKFQLIGAPDPGVSTAVSQEEIDGWLEEGIIAYSGLSEDMSASLAEVDVLILPTRHPEGTPRILIEAAASGVVAVAADIEGCRSVIEDGTTGLLVSPDENMVREMATRVMLLHSDRRMLEHLSVAATSYSSRRFSLKDTLAKVFAMLSIPKRRQDGYA